jgi:hypothetical protein
MCIGEFIPASTRNFMNAYTPSCSNLQRTNSRSETITNTHNHSQAPLPPPPRHCSLYT